MLMEIVHENLLKLSGNVSLSEIYSEFPDYNLFVEPLNTKKPLSDFISKGGFGYGTLREGPFNSKIHRIKWKRPKYSFKYGLMDSTLYAAGYPLHRIVAALPHELYNKSLGEIQEVIIPVRSREESKIVYESREAFDFDIPSKARDVLFVNEKAASLVGLPGQGKVTIYSSDSSVESEGSNGDEFLKNRFIEDNLDGQKVLNVLTQKSSAAKLHELVGENGIFFALSINIGLLVIVSEEGIREQLNEMPLTYVIGK